MVETDQAEPESIRGAEHFRFSVTADREGQRLDHYLVERLPAVSRSRLAKLIRQEFVLLNGGAGKAGSRLKAGDNIEINLPASEPAAIEPEKVAFEILYEDGEIIVIAKPPGLVVHPAAGHKKGTLVHGLLHHCDGLPGICGVERPGIVHRLDKDTSGVMVIAKTDKSHHGLVELFKSRRVKKVYHAIVAGRPTPRQGTMSRPIGRHRSNRKKMAVLEHGGREAVTSWIVREEFAAPLTYVEARPETGRTHQIRVHLAHLGYPVAGDALYSSKLQKQLNEEYDIKRQCLHAYSLSFAHPSTGEELEFVAPLWPDMQTLLEKLRQQSQSA